MLNHTHNDNSTHSVKMIAPCVGTLQKTHAKSKFIRFHSKSPMADCVFSLTPRLGKDSKEEIVTLQLMCFGEGEFLMEYVNKKDLED